MDFTRCRDFVEKYVSMKEPSRTLIKRLINSTVVYDYGDKKEVKINLKFKVLSHLAITSTTKNNHIQKANRFFLPNCKGRLGLYFVISYNYDHFLALIIKRKTNLIIDYYLKKLKFYENYKEIASFLIGCFTMVTYSFRVYYINN